MWLENTNYIIIKLFHTLNNKLTSFQTKKQISELTEDTNGYNKTEQIIPLKR